MLLHHSQIGGRVIQGLDPNLLMFNPCSRTITSLSKLAGLGAPNFCGYGLVQQRGQDDEVLHLRLDDLRPEGSFCLPVFQLD